MILEKGNPTDYDKSIATTWSISISAVQSERPIVVDFIYLLSFFAPENIPKFLFIDELEAFPEYLAFPIKNNDQLYDAISILARYSLISTNKDSIWIHRLVQATIRNSLKEKDKKRWARTAATLVKSVFYYDRENMQSWDKCALLLPHAQATARYAIEFDVALVEASDLFNQISGYLLARAEFSEAKIASESAIKIGERIHGPNNPKFADYLHNYGRVLRVNNLEEAKKVFERALNIDQNYLDADKAKVARDLCNIGSVQLEQGDVKGCNKSFETALAIDEIVTGIKNSKTISEVSANLLSNNELADAKNLFDRALRVSEKLSDKSLSLNTEQAKMVIRINNIGKLMYNERYLIEAKVLFEKVIEIGEKTLGYEHPNIALRINNLGRVLLDQGDTDGAQKAFEKAFSIGQKVLGMNHPYVAMYLNNLGAVEYKDSELERAEELFKRAIKINENILGIDNPYLAIYIKNLSKVLEERGDYKSAKELYERASRIEEKQKIDYWASKAVILDMPNTIGLVPGKFYEAQEKAKK